MEGLASFEANIPIQPLHSRSWTEELVPAHEIAGAPHRQTAASTHGGRCNRPVAHTCRTFLRKGVVACRWHELIVYQEEVSERVAATQGALRKEKNVVTLWTQTVDLQTLPDEGGRGEP